MPISRKRSHALAGLSTLALTASGLLLAAPAHAVSGVFLSEIHYDNAGTDTDEFVEVTAPAGTDLGDYSLVLYNGNDGKAYATVPLTGTVANHLEGWGALSFGYAGIQNGAPDGVALVMGATVLEFFSYEGSFAATEGPAVGTTATSMGVSQSGADPTGQTLQRQANGSWTGPTTSTKRVPNGYTTGTTPPPPPAPQALTIAQIQGTGATSSYSGHTVTTEGVVTASYPTGGLNGFFLQTGGSGGSPDATPEASDGIFVYLGTSGADTYPVVGDSVRVTGKVGEYFGATQITATTADVTPISTLPQVTPQRVVPGTDCALPGDGCLTGAALDAAREAHEGELFQPSGDYTVTDSYDGSPYPSTSSSFFGEIGLAAESHEPLVEPTEVIDAQDLAGVAARTAYNDAHRIVLDDGSSWSYSDKDNTDEPFPWLTEDHTVRVGAGVTFDSPVVLGYSHNAWKLLPQQQVVVVPSGLVTFEQDRPARPDQVGGDIRLATFNVLNYFPTTGVEFDALPGTTCTFYKDRAGDEVTVNRCDPDGPRGAAEEDDFERQEAKIVDAITKLDASIVSLEEIENSAKFGKDRDYAVSVLVDALNEEAGLGTWAYVPSPAPEERPAVADEDVIRTAFIYRPAHVDLVGASRILRDEVNFDNAREPLAQAFKVDGASDARAFAVIVNHFKSKGSAPNTGVNSDTGQGGFNDDRMAQAAALAAFADSFAADRGVEAVFLAGDFNSYSMEDPMQVLYGEGYDAVESDTEGEETYSFDGMVGSLDHVLANADAMSLVTGADVWNINSPESVYYEYGRYNSNETNLYTVSPFRSSDHDPEIIGIDDSRQDSTVAARATPEKVWAGRTRLMVHVRVTAPEGVPTGTVTVTTEDGATYTGTLADGSADIKVPPFAEPGRQVLTVRYSGDGDNRPGETTETVVVEQK